MHSIRYFRNCGKMANKFVFPIITCQPRSEVYPGSEISMLPFPIDLLFYSKNKTNRKSLEGKDGFDLIDNFVALY